MQTVTTVIFNELYTIISVVIFGSVKPSQESNLSKEINRIAGLAGQNLTKCLFPFISLIAPISKYTVFPVIV